MASCQPSFSNANDKSSRALFLLSMNCLYSPASCSNFAFLDPVDPLGKASGRNLLTMGLSRLVRLLEFTQGGFDLFSLPVNQARLLKP
jgi:putative component of membrane protein insertase Oxa1/YidC/SpoIIIJ protein YidD